MTGFRVNEDATCDMSHTSDTCSINNVRHSNCSADCSDCAEGIPNHVDILSNLSTSGNYCEGSPTSCASTTPSAFLGLNFPSCLQNQNIDHPFPTISPVQVPIAEANNSSTSLTCSLSHIDNHCILSKNEVSQQQSVPNINKNTTITDNDASINDLVSAQSFNCLNSVTNNNSIINEGTLNGDQSNINGFKSIMKSSVSSQVLINFSTANCANEEINGESNRFFDKLSTANYDNKTFHQINEDNENTSVIDDHSKVNFKLEKFIHIPLLVNQTANNIPQNNTTAEHFYRKNHNVTTSDDNIILNFDTNTSLNTTKNTLSAKTLNQELNEPKTTFTNTSPERNNNNTNTDLNFVDSSCGVSSIPPTDLKYTLSSEHQISETLSNKCLSSPPSALLQKTNKISVSHIYLSKKGMDKHDRLLISNPAEHSPCSSPHSVSKSTHNNFVPASPLGLLYSADSECRDGVNNSMTSKIQTHKPDSSHVDGMNDTVYCHFNSNTCVDNSFKDEHTNKIGEGSSIKSLSNNDDEIGNFLDEVASDKGSNNFDSDLSELNGNHLENPTSQHDMSCPSSSNLDAGSNADCEDDHIAIERNDCFNHDSDEASVVNSENYDDESVEETLFSHSNEQHESNESSAICENERMDIMGFNLNHSSNNVNRNASQETTSRNRSFNASSIIPSNDISWQLNETERRRRIANSSLSNVPASSLSPTPSNDTSSGVMTNLPTGLDGLLELRNRLRTAMSAASTPEERIQILSHVGSGLDDRVRNLRQQLEATRAQAMAHMQSLLSRLESLHPELTHTSSSVSLSREDSMPDVNSEINGAGHFDLMGEATDFAANSHISYSLGAAGRQRQRANTHNLSRTNTTAESLMELRNQIQNVSASATESFSNLYQSLDALRRGLDVATTDDSEERLITPSIENETLPTEGNNENDGAYNSSTFESWRRNRLRLSGRRRDHDEVSSSSSSSSLNQVENSSFENLDEEFFEDDNWFGSSNSRDWVESPSDISDTENFPDQVSSEEESIFDESNRIRDQLVQRNRRRRVFDALARSRRIEDVDAIGLELGLSGAEENVLEESEVEFHNSRFGLLRSTANRNSLFTSNLIGNMTSNGEQIVEDTSDSDVESAMAELTVEQQLITDAFHRLRQIASSSSSSNGNLHNISSHNRRDVNGNINEEVNMSISSVSTSSETANDSSLSSSHTRGNSDAERRRSLLVNLLSRAQGLRNRLAAFANSRGVSSTLLSNNSGDEEFVGMGFDLVEDPPTYNNNQSNFSNMNELSNSEHQVRIFRTIAQADDLSSSSLFSSSNLNGQAALNLAPVSENISVERTSENIGEIIRSPPLPSALSLDMTETAWMTSVDAVVGSRTRDLSDVIASASADSIDESQLGIFDLSRRVENEAHRRRNLTSSVSTGPIGLSLSGSATASFGNSDLHQHSFDTLPQNSNDVFNNSLHNRNNQMNLTSPSGVRALADDAGSDVSAQSNEFNVDFNTSSANRSANENDSRATAVVNLSIPNIDIDDEYNDSFDARMVRMQNLIDSLRNARQSIGSNTVNHTSPLITSNNRRNLDLELNDAEDEGDIFGTSRADAERTERRRSLFFNRMMHENQHDDDLLDDYNFDEEEDVNELLAHHDDHDLADNDEEETVLSSSWRTEEDGDDDETVHDRRSASTCSSSSSDHLELVIHGQRLQPTSSMSGLPRSAPGALSDEDARLLILPAPVPPPAPLEVVSLHPETGVPLTFTALMRLALRLGRESDLYERIQRTAGRVLTLHLLSTRCLDDHLSLLLGQNWDNLNIRSKLQTLHMLANESNVRNNSLHQDASFPRSDVTDNTNNPTNNPSRTISSPPNVLVRDPLSSTEIPHQTSSSFPSAGTDRGASGANVSLLAPPVQQQHQQSNLDPHHLTPRDRRISLGVSYGPPLRRLPTDGSNWSIGSNNHNNNNNSSVSVNHIHLLNNSASYSSQSYSSNSQHHHSSNQNEQRETHQQIDLLHIGLLSEEGTIHGRRNLRNQPQMVRRMTRTDLDDHVSDDEELDHPNNTNRPLIGREPVVDGALNASSSFDIVRTNSERRVRYDLFRGNAETENVFIEDLTSSSSSQLSLSRDDANQPDRLLQSFDISADVNVAAVVCHLCLTSSSIIPTSRIGQFACSRCGTTNISSSTANPSLSTPLGASPPPRPTSALPSAHRYRPPPFSAAPPRRLPPVAATGVSSAPRNSFGLRGTVGTGLPSAAPVTSSAARSIYPAIGSSSSLDNNNTSSGNVLGVSASGILDAGSMSRADLSNFIRRMRETISSSSPSRSSAGERRDDLTSFEGTAPTHSPSPPLDALDRNRGMASRSRLPFLPTSSSSSTSPLNYRSFVSSSGRALDPGANNTISNENFDPIVTSAAERNLPPAQSLVSMTPAEQRASREALYKRNVLDRGCLLTETAVNNPTMAIN